MKFLPIKINLPVKGIQKSVSSKGNGVGDISLFGENLDFLINSKIDKNINTHNHKLTTSDDLSMLLFMFLFSGTKMEQNILNDFSQGEKDSCKFDASKIERSNNVENLHSLFFKLREGLQKDPKLRELLEKLKNMLKDYFQKVDLKIDDVRKLIHIDKDENLSKTLKDILSLQKDNINVQHMQKKDDIVKELKNIINKIQNHIKNKFPILDSLIKDTKDSNIILDKILNSYKENKEIIIKEDNKENINHRFNEKKDISYNSNSVDRINLNYNLKQKNKIIDIKLNIDNDKGNDNDLLIKNSVLQQLQEQDGSNDKIEEVWNEIKSSLVLKKGKNIIYDEKTKNKSNIKEMLNKNIMQEKNEFDLKTILKGADKKDTGIKFNVTSDIVKQIAHKNTSTSNSQHLERNFRDEILRQVEEGMIRSLGQGRREFSIKLHPPELGALKLMMHVQNKHVSVVIHTENSDVASALNKHIANFEKAFEQQGLKLVKIEVKNDLFSGQESPWRDFHGSKDHHNPSYASRRRGNMRVGLIGERELEGIEVEDMRGRGVLYATKLYVVA